MHIRYTAADMYKESFIGIVILMNTAFGSLCMMPMTTAMAAPVSDHSMHATTKNTSPMDAMSHADCDHCQDVSQSEIPRTNSCFGHCITPTVSPVSVSAEKTFFQVSAAIATINVFDVGRSLLQSKLYITATSPQVTSSPTIVLLF